MSKPNKTLADHLVVSISPVLIMLLVGSLCYFLIDVLFKNAEVSGVRWVMFWFIMAIVLVARIGIEQTDQQAFIYGAFLAVATGLYMLTVHSSFILLGLLLLGLVWWCAHKLTWDCTVIEDDDDASGSGLLQTAVEAKSFQLTLNKSLKKPAAKLVRDDDVPPKTHAPGLWVVYFSIGALPLFGFGQVLLPHDDHGGFYYLFTYVAAAAGLLLTTSFLGLRRYLRQRYLPMPPMIAFGWIRLGIGVALFVLVGALFLPRPGVNAAWAGFSQRVDHTLRQASDYAMRLSPHGKGEGRQGNEAKPNPGNEPPQTTAKDGKPEAGSGQTPTPRPDGVQKPGEDAQQSSGEDSSSSIFRWFKLLFWLGLILLAGWWIYRRRVLLGQILRSIYDAVMKFFRDLFQGGSRTRQPAVVKAPSPARRRFASFVNPFLKGEHTSWSKEQLVLYSYEALQAWAEEQGVKPRPEQTSREFCAELGERYPGMVSDLRQLSALYSQAAYRLAVPAGCDLEPVKNLWRSWGAG
ncbi:MAG TPA: DUF4129 domain-containing protein [Candidatus Acidoferrales bacterium]|nr:DUF4129 domain-containing protein [Candidatus Acidoferrales bacterium]